MRIFSGINNKSRGQILIEVLAAAFIVALFSPSLIAVFKFTMERCISIYDLRVAMQRIAAAEAILREPVFYCSYGMSNETYEYRKAFGNQEKEPFNWAGPIAVDSYNGKLNAVLKIAYAKRGKLYSFKRSVCMSEGIVQLNSAPDSNNLRAVSSGIPSSVKNFVIFGGMSPLATPLCVRKISGANIIVSTPIYDNFCISSADPMYHFCAMKVYASNGRLYSYDFRASGNQPRIDGITDVRFYLSDGKSKILTVYLLTEGKVKRNKSKVKLLNFDEDATNADLLSEWNCINNNHTLYASKVVWSLPNCISSAEL